MAIKTAHLYVSGRVQGVFFRQSTRKLAMAQGIVGWIRNLADGRVEIMATGNEEDVEALVEWCHEGPDLAHVESVDLTFLEEPLLFEGFEVRKTIKK